MDLSITQVPIWISVVFGLSMISVPVLLISRLAITPSIDTRYLPSRDKARQIAVFYFLFFLLMALISLTGFFTVNTLPPRVIVFAAIPLLLFYLLYVQRQAWFKSAFAAVTVAQLIQVHVFRFVGVFFYILYAYEALPRPFAVIGGTGDILTALLAIPTVYFLKKKAAFAKALAWAWNIFGLLDILSVIAVAIVTTRFAIANNETGVGQFGTFPFSWIPTFAPATIIFLHILIFRKLRTPKA